MSRHQRLQHSLASPARAGHQRHNRRHRIARRKMMAEFREMSEREAFYRRLMLDELIGMRVHHPVSSLVLGPLTG